MVGADYTAAGLGPASSEHHRINRRPMLSRSPPPSGLHRWKPYYHPILSLTPTKMNATRARKVFPNEDPAMRPGACQTVVLQNSRHLAQSPPNASTPNASSG